MRLQNPTTNQLIGEIFISFPLDRNRIQFMVERQPGVFLRVNEFGRVDYANVRDAASTFIMEPIPGTGHMHLLPE